MGGPGSGRKKGSKNRVKSSGPSNASKLGRIKSASGLGTRKTAAKASAGKGSKIKATVSTSRKLSGKSFATSKFGKEYKSDYKYK